MTATQKFLQRYASGAGLQETLPATAGGAGNEGKIASLDTSTGLLPLTMMPTGIGPDTITVDAAVSIANGKFVNLYDATGTASARLADNTDATKPAHGFVLTGAASGPVVVYKSGLNNIIPIGGFVAADLGKPVYLSTAGGVTLTRSTAAGSLDQQLGVVDIIGATLGVNFDFQPGIVVL
jgi:hypothetical protein